MSDNWNIPDPQQTNEPSAPQEPVTPPVPSAPQEPVMTPAPSAPQEPTPTQEPVTPQNAGWSNGSSYRYVPRDNGVPPVPPFTPNNNGQGNPYPYSRPNGVPPVPPPKKHNGLVIALAIIAAVAVVASVVFLGLGMVNKVSPDVSVSDPVTSTESSQDLPNENAPSLEITDWDDNDGGLSYKEIVNRNYDSTVVITTYTNNNSYNFGESGLVETGAASGIVMSEDGYIITNWHCVINEDTGRAFDRVDVTLHDGKTYEGATIIGADESTDLAVIKIEATGLSVAQFGDSATLSVGDRVATLGNAAGLSWTATFGYVSAVARDVYEDTGYAIKCLQVDAAINPGNSGGPLLNNQGLVVGINSAKIAATGYEGLGFSIPINEAKTIIDSLVKFGYVKGRVALGIKGQTISSGMYSGFLITEIERDSAFEGTKAAEGDLIVGVDGVDVTNYGELRSELAKHEIGDKVTLELLRSSKNGRVTSFNVTVTLKEQKSTN